MPGVLLPWEKPLYEYFVAYIGTTRGAGNLSAFLESPLTSLDQIRLLEHRLARQGIERPVILGFQLLKKHRKVDVDVSKFDGTLTLLCESPTPDSNRKPSH